MDLTQVWQTAKNMGGQAYPSRLRSVVALANNQTTFKLPLLADQSVIAAGFENRLNPSDAFVATHIGMRWTNATAATIDEGPLFTNENSTEADAAADIGAIYGGHLDLVVNTKLVAEWSADLFRYVPEAQAGATTAAIAGPVTYTTPLDSVGPGAGFISSYPLLITLDGSAKNEFTLNLASGKADIAPDTDSNYIVLDIRGFYVVGGSSK